MKPNAELPHDPALPALAVISSGGLARVVPSLVPLAESPHELLLCGYSAGSRATLDVRVGGRRFALKVYADDPAPEAELYQALASAGLGGPSGPRVPALIAWEPELRVLAISWLDGTPTNELVKQGQGARAGELAARWLWRVASVPVRVGPAFGVGATLYQAGKSVAMLAAANGALGAAAKAVARMLRRTHPRDGVARLVHGTLYARHVLDLGDGPGVIDWQRFGQGPVELDAGMFLATIDRLRLRHPLHAAEAARAEEAFLGSARGLLDDRALAWYRAAALLHLSSRLLKREPPAEAGVLLREAARLAEDAGRTTQATRAVHLATLELVLQALSSRPATAEELEQIRRLLDPAS